MFYKKKKKRSIFRHRISWRKQYGEEIGITKFGGRIPRQNYFLLQRGVKKGERSSKKIYMYQSEKVAKEKLKSKDELRRYV